MRNPNIFDVTYTDSSLAFTFYPMPADTTAVNDLRRHIGRILESDARLGRGNKRVEYITSDDVVMWDDLTSSMRQRFFHNSVRITFSHRDDAAVFRLIYCANDEFLMEPTVFG